MSLIMRTSANMSMGMGMSMVESEIMSISMRRVLVPEAEVGQAGHFNGDCQGQKHRSGHQILA